MELIERKSSLWIYMAPEIQGLLEDGEILIDFVIEHKESSKISDYSFLVFPFAKAYEGYLKKLFLDIGMIQPDEYYSDDIRIGRILNPNYPSEEENVFFRLCGQSKRHHELSDVLWSAWKIGRNAVFHFFPHNFRRLNYDEAMDIIREIINGMELTVEKCKLPEDIKVPLDQQDNVVSIA